MRTFSEDYRRGLASEITVHMSLEEGLDCKLEKTVDPKHRMDFEGDDCWVELKTRFGVSSQTYQTMLLPVSKILFAKEASKPVYFFFALSDGIFYIQFNAERFKGYRLENVVRRDRGETLAVRHCHIPCSDLDWIEKYQKVT